MNQDVLSLYKKAQNGGLNAQEVFWLEGQAAAHPAFSLVHTILARHHFRNQSTIKNKALLKAAAYSNNRGLLRSYLEDTLTTPKSRPIPVSEMRQNLEKREPEVKAEEPSKINLEKPAEPEVQPQNEVSAVVESSAVEVSAVVETAVEPVAEVVAVVEEPAVASVVEETLVADASHEVASEGESVEPEEVVAAVSSEELAEQPAIEISSEQNEVAEPIAELNPVAELESKDAAEEVIAAEVVAEASNEPVSEPMNAVAEVTSVEEAPAESPSPMIGSGPKAGQINWYLQTRVKFRVDRYLGTFAKITASVEKFAPSLAVIHVTASAPALESVQAEVVSQLEAQPIQEIPSTEAVVEVVENAPIEVVEAHAEPVDASSLSIEEERGAEVASPAVEPVIEVVNSMDEQAEVESQSIVAEADARPEVIETPAVEPSTSVIVESVAALTEANPEVAAPEAPIAAVVEPVVVEPVVARAHPKPPTIRPREKAEATRPDTGYEIGSFSSFTFLSDGPADDSEEVIDTGIGTMEAVEFQATTVAGSEEAEIIFEENDRIIEISVSPAALEKYFKGRLPVEPKLSFGEFKIELDELEYRSLDEADAETVKELATVAVVSEPVQEEVEEVVADGPKGRKRGEDLIDKFIENEPTITRGKAGMAPSGDLSRDSSHLHDDWVTETLGRIYEKQGNKSKAIKIYEKLRLRFPEKSDYFGLLIEKLKHS